MNGATIISAIYALSTETFRFDTDGDKLGFWDVYHQLCHQNTITGLTYSAVPHLVHLIRKKTLIPLSEALMLLSAIKLSSMNEIADTPIVSSDVKTDFRVALRSAANLCTEYIQQPNLAPADYVLGVTALAGLNNLRHVYQALMWVYVEKSAIVRCPSCFAEYEITTDELPFSLQFIQPHPTHPDTSFGTPCGTPSPVHPANVRREGWTGAITEDNASIWMSFFAGTADQKGIENTLRFLFGRYSCRKCSEAQFVWDTLLHQSKWAASC